MKALLERRRGLLYGRRKGPKLSAARQSLKQDLLPKLTFRVGEGRDPRLYFDTDVADLWFEVGFGGGEHLVWQAAHHPDVGLIGAEPYEAGVAKLIAALASDENRPLATRIRIYEGDARDVLAALPDKVLGRVFILFPDPWPKTRHHKRRFIQTEMLSTLARVMRENAELRFASDDPGYFDWALERLTAHPCFSWQARVALDWETRPEDWPETRYEKKALHGRPLYLRFRRNDTSCAAGNS